jgi:ribose transport system permease protein
MGHRTQPAPTGRRVDPREERDAPQQPREEPVVSAASGSEQPVAAVPGPGTVSGGGSTSGEGSSGAPGPARYWLSRFLRVECLSVLVATLVLGAFIGILHPDFLSSSQIRDVLQQSVYVAILASGMAFLLAMREIDLSVGSIFGLTLIIAALLMQGGMNPWIAALIGIACAGGMGLVNAVLVQVIAIPAIVATLATLSMYRGLALALSHGQQVTKLPFGNSFFTFLGGKQFGIPVSVWGMILIAIVMTAILRLTPFGYRVRAIGSNPEAATFSGISIPRVRVQALVMMGILAGIAGIFGLAFFESGEPNIGSGFEFEAIAAAVIGGTSLRGGNATVVGAMIGAILLTEVSSGLVYFNVPQNWSAFATGAVILVAVSLDSIVRLRGRRSAERGGLGL